MTKSRLTTLSIGELVKRFADIGVQQYDALMGDDVKTFNRLYEQMDAVVQELRARTGDQRQALIPLYKHTNPQVRMKAAINSLACNYSEARQVLEDVANSQKFPTAGHAGMILEGLEQGDFKPT